MHKKKYRSVEDDRESRHKPLHPSHLIHNKQNKSIHQRKNSPLVRAAGETGQLYVNQRNENTP